MKKRFLGITLAAILTASLAGCGGAATGSSTADSAAAVGSSAAAEETASSAGTSSAGDTASVDTGDLMDWEKAYVDEGYVVSGDEELTVALIAKDFKDTFDQQITSAVEDYFEKAYPNVKLVVGDGQADVNMQVQLAENYITQGVDALMLAAADSDGCVVICETAREAGIPLVVVNSDVACPDVDHFFSGSDHFYSGQLQAEYLIDNVDDSEKPNICYLGGTNGFTHAKLRREGVFETLDKAGYNYNLMSDQEGKYLRDKAMEITEDWIIQYGEDIDIIVAANDEMAMGAMSALQAANIKDVIICGIDANQDACEAIQKGTLAMTVFQDAVSQGKWAAVEAYTVATKGMDPEYLSIPYLPVTAENVDEYL